MTSTERMSEIVVRDEVYRFEIANQDVYQITTENGSELIVDLSNIESGPHGKREIVLISDDIAGKIHTGNSRSTASGERRIELSRSGTGSQPLSQPEGGFVKVDLGFSLYDQKPAKLKIEKDGIELSIKANVYFPNPKLDLR